MAKSSRKKRRKSYSSSEEEDSSNSESETSSEEESEYDYSYDSSDDSSSDSDDDSEDSESGSDNDDYEQLLEVLTRHNLKQAAKKLVSNNVFTVNKARSIPVSKLVKKYGISESQAKGVHKLLNNPTALLPPVSSDSDSDSSDVSEDEDELVWRILRSIDQTSLIKVFKRHKITSLKPAYKLTDKKLKRMGIASKDLREKLVNEFKKKKDNKTSTEEDDEIKVAKIMKSIDMKPYIKNLQKGKVTDLETAYSLSSSTLKALGVTSKRDRSKILKAFKEYKKTHAEDDPSLAILKRALTKVGLRKYYTKLKNKDIDSIRRLKKIDHKDLREIGVQMYRERREILEKIEKINSDGTVDVADASEDEGSDGSDNVINAVLRSLYMSRHIPDFKRANISSLKEGRKLTQTQLRAMGVALYLDREKLINAFKDYRPKNKKIMKILIDQNLARHTSEFEKLVDIDEARSLTHADLRAMGVSLYGQRDRLIKAFASYQSSDSESDSNSVSEVKSRASKRSKSRGRRNRKK